MSWLQLDPASIAARARADSPPRIPSPAASLLIGIAGFTLVSIAGFIPWAVFGYHLGRQVGETGSYAISALVFIALSGPALHRLIIGPGSLVRFYPLFAVAFTLYAACWIAAWESMRGFDGSAIGLAAGTFAFSCVLAFAFHAWRQFPGMFASLFLLNAAGYFIGGRCDAALYSVRPLAGHVAWGACYGLGFGAGLGMAFHLAQTEARRILAKRG